MVVCICLCAAPALAIDGTWTGATNSDWHVDTNWSPGPAPNNTASFTNNGAPTSVAIGGLSSINTIQFAAGAPTYSFTFPVSLSQAFTINGAGIINNSSNAPIFGVGQVFFKNGSTAGNAIFSVVEFDDHSNAGTATISNTLGSGSTAEFTGTSSAANATITTNNGSQTSFGDNSTGGNANIITNSGGRTVFAGSSTAGNASILTRNGGRTDFFTQATGQASFVTEAGGIVDFSSAFGAGSSHQISAGSIAGAGNYFLGRNALTVGSNGLSTTVDGVIADGGISGGAGASLIKIGAGTLLLSGANSYTGGTTINAGTLEASHATAGAIDVFGNNTINISGGALRSTVSGQIANGISFANGATGTFSAAAAHTVTTTGFLTFSDNSIARFGSATDTGTVVIGPPGGIFISSSSQLEVNGGMLRSAVGSNFLSSLTGANASTTVAASATLDFNDQMSPSLGGINSLLGSGRVVIGTNATTDLRIASGTFAGEIAGAGSVHVANFFPAALNGTLLLTGANSYTGGTIVDANHMLQIGSGGATGSIVGNVVNEGVFAINRSNAYTFAGVISGSGAFQQNGSGISSLTSANTYTGTTFINAGTLIVDGSIASSSLTTVNVGGTLGGNGIVGNTVINGGTLSPGNSIGVLTVQGSLVFTAASSYMVEVSPANSDRVNVSGAATLGGATVQANFAAGSYAARQYTILSASGGVIGTFGSLASTNVPPTLAVSLSYDTNNVYLNLDLAVSKLPGLNNNQQNVGNALGNYFNANGGIPFVFVTLTPTGLTQVSGETAVGSQQATFNAMTQFLGTLLDPFIGGRGETSASTTSATPFATEGDANGYASAGGRRTEAEREAYAAIYRKASTRDSYDPRWSVWSAGFGGSQSADGNAAAGSNNTTSRVFGVAAGADYVFSPRTIAGFALAGGGTNFSVVNGGSGRSDLFQAGAFIKHNAGNAYVSAALAYGWQDITTDRTVTVAGVDRLRAEFNANALSGRVEGGYRFVAPWVGGAGITPYAAGQFTGFDLPAYAEQVVLGANIFALSYAAKTVTASRSELGLRADKSFAMPNAVLILRGRVAWAHDFNADRNVAATFQTLPGASFVVNGAAQGPDAALTTASAEIKWLNGFSLAGVFEGEFSSVTRSYAGKGVARYAW